MEKVSIPTRKFGPLTALGSSVAGIATSIAIKELSLCFDVANGWEFLTPIKNILITHGHMDHAGGLPYLLSQKSMTKQLRAKIYLPEAIVDPMKKIINLWSEIEDHEYDFELIANDFNTTHMLNPNWSFRAFPTIHRVPSNGYTLFQNKKTLKEEFKSKSRQEILDAKSKGIEIESKIESPLLSFTGDTQIEFFDGPEWVRRSKYLIMEVSFLDEKRTVEEARKWGHIHLDELIENFDRFLGEKIIVIHLSKRYRLKEARKIIDEKFEAHGLDKSKIELFGQLSL